MNLPSFALGNLAGKIEVTRTLTALTPGVYKAKFNVPGIKVSVTPAVLNFSAAGEKRTFKVSFENQGAPLGKFATGSLTWQGANKNVASPIAVRPQSVVALSDVAFTSEGGTGSGAIKVVSGTQRADQHDPRRSLEGRLHGRRARPGSVHGRPGCLERRQDRHRSRPAPRWPSSRSFPRTRSADFDMYVMTPNGPLTVATSSASESVSIPNPTPGKYTIYANLYASPNNQATKASVDAAVLGQGRGQGLAEPEPAAARQRQGRQGHAELGWASDGSYIGRVTFAGASDPTFVSVLVTPAGTVVVPPTSEDQDSKTVRVTTPMATTPTRTRRTRARR